MFPVTWRTDHSGRAQMGGVDFGTLAEAYGTPLLVLDKATLVDRLTAYRNALPSAVGDPAYASKAFMCVGMAQLVDQAGLHLDVVSGGELYTALKAGLPAERIHLHGNLKTRDELAFAMEQKVGQVVIDSLTEIKQVAEQARRLGRRQEVLLRVAPGIEPKTHQYVVTGHHDAKFGLAMVSGDAARAVECILSEPELRLVGYHSHVGSQILELWPFEENARVMMRFSADIFKRYGFWPQELNLGGGLGISYLPDQCPPSIEAYIASMREILLTESERLGRACPRLVVEPGRSIVGPAGVTLYRVGLRKEVPGRVFVAVDGGMGDNPRPALYQSAYTALLANRATEPPVEEVAVAGRYCESGDILIERTSLPKAAPGDLLVMLGTGAYQQAMASTYNHVPRPAVVLVGGGQATVLQRRETYADLVARDASLVEESVL